MAQSQSPRQERRIEAHTLEEGDEVFMGIHMHGSVEDYDDVEYDLDLHQAGVRGTVTEVPRDSIRELMADDTRVMADIVVESDSGEWFRWQMDNGYVLSYHQGLDRRSDIGRFGGFYE